jgi:hypothetical protein
MNPIKWVRWKVVIVIGAICGTLYFLGLNPVAKRVINGVGSGGNAGARFSIDQVGLGLLQGRTSFDGFLMATPQRKDAVPATAAADEKARVMKADEIVCDLGMDDFLRKRFAVDEVGIVKPLLRLERRADGTINVGDLGQKEPQPSDGKSRDWWQTVQDWGKKVKEKIDERKKKEAEGPKKTEPKDKGAVADYDRAIEYPFANLPKALVRKLSAEALEIRFEDAAGGVQPPPIENAKVEITNLSDRPEVSAEPIGLNLSGKIAGADLKITGNLDLRKILETGIQKDDLVFKVSAQGLPLQQVVQAFAGDSLGATFEKGTVDLNADLSLIGMDQLSVRAPTPGAALLSLHGVQMKAKPGSKIAGFDGEQFAQALNEVGDFEIKDLEIGGTLTSPQFKWGESIKELVMSGGKAFAQKQAQKGLDKGLGEAQKLLDKQSPDAKKAIGNIIPGGDAKKAADGLFGNLLGGKKTEAPAPAPEPKK